MKWLFATTGPASAARRISSRASSSRPARATTGRGSRGSSRADAKYTWVVTADSEALIRTPLRQLQEGLDPGRFWPIHRSTIVNAPCIASVGRDPHGRVAVRLRSRPEKLTVSEAHAHLFKQM
jgi:hypothetical protein